MTVSWAWSDPEDLRVAHARDAAERAGDLPSDVVETQLPPNGAFQGGSLFTPPGSSDAVIVYFHGGGFVAGSPQTHRSVTAWLAQLAGMRVLSARYRLAPEHRYPAQAEDAVAACVAAGALEGSPAEGRSIILAGDSAGACVALWGLRGLAAATRALVKGLVLFYGGYGLVGGPSVARYGTAENGLDAETLAIMYQRLQGAHGRPEWPAEFAAEIVEPAYVLAAGLDAVFDDSVRLHAALATPDADKLLVPVEGQDHGFLKGCGRDAAAMRELERAARWAAGRTLWTSASARP